MGWSNCGNDSKGRPIGYGFAATCDQPGCNAEIDRGLGYACGGMHGTGSLPDIGYDTCEGYFCEDHLTHVWPKGDFGDGCQCCQACRERIEAEARENGDDPDAEGPNPWAKEIA